MAAENDQSDNVELLLEYKASIDLGDKGGRTALHETAEKERSEMLELLLKNKASIDLQDTVMPAWAFEGRGACVVDYILVIWVRVHVRPCGWAVGSREPMSSQCVL